ncbi:MAG: TonB-dependent siderophore receptor [Sphingorhabdus sp.]
MMMFGALERSCAASHKPQIWTQVSRGALIAVLLSAVNMPAFAQENSQDDSANEDIVVEGRIQFRERETDSALKLTLPAKEVPQSVTVITEDVIEFANIRRFDEIYRVDASAGTSNRTDEFPSGYYRGFATQGTNALRIDGFRFVGNIDLDLVAFERFEVVKGPTSALYGQNNIGGALNAVLKKPTRDSQGEALLSYGSFDTFRGEFDYSGALNESGTVKARLVAAYTQGDSHIDFVTNKSFIVAPSLAFELGEMTSFNISAIYQRGKDRGNGFGIAPQLQADGSYAIPDVPRSLNSGQRYQISKPEAAIVFAQLQHKFSDDWRVRVLGQYSQLKRTVNAFGLFSYLDEDFNTDGCCAYLRDDSQKLWGGEINLIGDFDTFGNKSTIFIGADYARQKQRRFNSFAYINADGDLGGITTVIDVPVLDADGNPVLDADGEEVFINNPGYNLLTTPRNLARPTKDDFYFHNQNNEKSRFAGITGQLLLQPVKGLKLILAGRYSFDKLRFDDRSITGFGAYVDLPNEPFETAINTTEKFVPQVGITYAATDDINIYANWGKTYEPSTARAVDPNDPTQAGPFLPPEEGRQYEAGIKGEFLNRKLSVSAAIFDIRRKNISAPDPNFPTESFSIPIGTQSSRGFELSANGNVTPNWSIFFSTAILDAKFKAGELAGLRPVNAAKFAVSLFSTYEFLDGPLKGFGFGGGYVHKKNGRASAIGPDDADGDGFNEPVTIRFGSINELSVNAFYENDDWEISLSANNLTKDKYYSPAFNDFAGGINVNPGRTFTLSVARKF